MKQFIECPSCGSVELGTIEKGPTPFHSFFVHECTSCRSIIQESEWEQLKALSIKQPWAWLIVNGYKDIENRKTLKHLKGKFLIHAGMKFDYEGYTWVMGNLKKLSMWCKFIMKPNEFKTGGIVGYVEFNGSVQKSDSPWFAGPNGLIIENAKPLDFIPCKGQQGVFYPDING